MTGVARTTIRMYNVGFGDCFLVTVRDDDTTWRMLVDCGVHSHGGVKINGRRWRIREIVRLVIDDLERDTPPGAGPRLDVVVATHRHADHISGFAVDGWERVSVGEVWLPFTEDPDDDESRTIRGRLDSAAHALHAMASALGVTTGSWPSKVALADGFALNALSNDDAMDRLLGRNGRGFSTDSQPPRVRFLPDRDSAANIITTAVEGVSIHILGPTRDSAQLRRMDPPTSIQWLEADDSGRTDHSGEEALFDPPYRVRPDQVRADVPEALRHAKNVIRLDSLAKNQDELLAAAAGLERAVNNTSVFFTLDMNGKHLVFVGDSQYGAWEHVLRNPEARGQITDALFYKIGHHGSHNGTHREFVEKLMSPDAYAMLPWGAVKAWKSIPKETLLGALNERRIRLVRADQPDGGLPNVTVDPELRWSEITFAA